LLISILSFFFKGIESMNHNIVMCVGPKPLINLTHYGKALCGKNYGTAHAVQLNNLTNLFALCLQTESWICEVAGTVTSQPAWSTVNARQHGEPSTGVVNHS